MRILLVSSGSWARPSFGYRMKAALERLGHEVIPFNQRALQLHRFPAGRAFLGRHLLALARRKQPDVLLVDKGESIPPGTVTAIGKEGIKTACWMLDDPFGTDNSMNALSNIAEYDGFFCFDSTYLPELKKINPGSYFLPCAVDPSMHREIIPERERAEKYDISFIGSHYPNRQEFLTRLADLPLNIWGYRWKEKTQGTPLAPRVHAEVYRQDKRENDLRATCRLFNETKINLNVHFTHSKRSPNLRAFEIPATKSFELCDYLPDLEQLFVIGKEIAVYRSADDCRRRIRYYLDHPDERRKIARAGYKRVLAEHTFDHRMRTLLSTLKKR
ncbi:MAG TPA: glycosyltransferase [Candidatus Binatia bacterium]|nr:glycosyltransferase [Candidatus Binatia bacterium]